MPIIGNTCAAIEIDLTPFLDLSIQLPGGVSLDAKIEPGTFPSLSAIVQSVLEPLNAAMTPLMPFFRLLDLVISIVEFCKAVPDSITSLDPGLLIEKLEAMAKAFAKVAGMIPPLSLPIMIVGVCKTISAGLLALILELEHSIMASLRISIAREKVETLKAHNLFTVAAALEASLDCAQADLDMQAAASSGGLGPLNKFIDLLNAFLGLIGIDPIGAVEPGGGNPMEMLQPLKDAVALIATICGSIPV